MTAMRAFAAALTTLLALPRAAQESSFLLKWPQLQAVVSDRGYDAGWLRNALIERGITPFIPYREGRNIAVSQDKTLYRKRHRIENMFGRLKDWRWEPGSNLRWERRLARMVIISPAPASYLPRST